ncbi:MAG: MFS transporter [Rickettsiales bacterium]|nr:MFS transporter [Rickettsiales bacterium]OUW03151.1 MAG: MFS transporter [Betaproteobacteria bacterium TMED156]
MISNEFRELLGYKSFSILLLVRILGITSYQILIVTVAWQLYDLTSSVWDLGLVGLFQFIPALLLSLPAGQMVDRFHKGKILVFCFASHALVASLLFYFTAYNIISRETIFLLAGVLGTTRAFQMPSQQSLTPALVPKKILQNAVALSSTTMHSSIIIGPAIGGFLYVLGPDIVYSICMLLFISASILSTNIKYNYLASNSKISFSGIFEGIKFICANKTVLGAISLDLFAVLLGGATALLPVFAKDILQTGPEGLGILRASPALGALICALVVTQWPMKRKVGKKLFLSVTFFGLSMLVFALSTNFLLSVIALVISGAADSLSVVIRMTLIQLETPDSLRGRVSSVNAIFIGASNELGEFESGATAAFLGPVGSVIFGSIGTLVVVIIWAKKFPMLLTRNKL